jgi:hypothetical protein
MSDLDPVLGKMIFQNVIRWTPLLIGLALLLVGAGYIETRQTLVGAFVLLVGLGLVALPFMRLLKEALEIDQD